MYKLLNDEEQFYKDYQWCIDPMPRWEDLRSRCIGELERWLRHADGWQAEESTLNCWLMSCALAQTLNDFLVRGNFEYGPCEKRGRWWETLLNGAHRCGTFIIRLRNRMLYRELQRCAGEWKTLLVSLAGCLTGASAVASQGKREIRAAAMMLLERPYPERLLKTRITLPAAFRSQDLTHYDVVRLLQQYVDSAGDHDTPLVVVGVRTAGEYFAPLAKVYLASKGFSSVDFVTLRPEKGLSADDHRHLRRSARNGCRFLIISEAPRSGNAVREAVTLMHRYGVGNERLDIAFPVYPAHTRWKQNLRVDGLSGIRIYTLSWSYWYLVEKMKPENIRRVLKEYYDAQEECLVGIEESPKGKSCDERFGRPERIGWRLKQVYRVRLWDRGGNEHVEDILVKSAGWGWLGYHAYIEADRLKGFVPPLLGIRSGLMFTRWIDGKNAEGAGVSGRRVMSDVLRYIFERSDKLPLSEDMTFKDCARHYYGGELLCRILSRAYGRHLGIFIRPLMRRLLRQYVTRYPTAIDGKMAPREWIYSQGRLWKTDFEHHGFGQAQLNIADPVFDLASFVFEFRLNRKEMDEAARRYREHTGDTQVKDKLVLYIWLIAHHNIVSVREHLSEPYRYRWSLRENEKYLNDCAYIGRFTVEYLGSLVAWPRKRNRGGGCWQLDLDRMMNERLWPFPSMTLRGVRNMAQLRRQGCPVIVRSSHDIEEVKHCCDQFDLDGGVAECGSVAWNRKRRREMVLAPPAAIDQIRLLQSRLLEHFNVYIDTRLRYMVKAFHYRDGITVPVDPGLVENIVVAHRLDQLKIVHRSMETIVIPSCVDTRRAGRLLQRLFSFAGDVRPFEGRMGERPGAREAESPVHTKPRQGGKRIAAVPANGTRPRLSGGHAIAEEKTDQQGRLLLMIMGVADRPCWARLFSIIGGQHIL